MFKMTRNGTNVRDILIRVKSVRRLFKEMRHLAHTVIQRIVTTRVLRDNTVVSTILKACL